jgi:hypothetical protein
MHYWRNYDYGLRHSLFCPNLTYASRTTITQNNFIHVLIKFGTIIQYDEQLCLVECRTTYKMFCYGHKYKAHIEGVPGGKVNNLGGHSIGHSKQKLCMYMCPIPNGFRNRAILPYSTLYRRETRHVLT